MSNYRERGDNIKNILLTNHNKKLIKSYGEIFKSTKRELSVKARNTRIKRKKK